MIRILFALFLICSQVVACEDGDCWIQKYLMSQYVKKYSTYDIYPLTGIIKDAYDVMHKQQLDLNVEIKKYPELNALSESKWIESQVKINSYRYLIKKYECQKSFISYLFFNTPIKGVIK